LVHRAADSVEAVAGEGDGAGAGAGEGNRDRAFLHGRFFRRDRARDGGEAVGLVNPIGQRLGEQNIIPRA
jgi:hypothetical protein